MPENDSILCLGGTAELIRTHLSHRKGKGSSKFPVELGPQRGIQAPNPALIQLLLDVKPGSLDSWLHGIRGSVREVRGTQKDLESPDLMTAKAAPRFCVWGFCLSVKKKQVSCTIILFRNCQNTLLLTGLIAGTGPAEERHEVGAGGGRWGCLIPSKGSQTDRLAAGRPGNHTEPGWSLPGRFLPISKSVPSLTAPPEAWQQVTHMVRALARATLSLACPLGRVPTSLLTFRPPILADASPPTAARGIAPIPSPRAFITRPPDACVTAFLRAGTPLPIPAQLWLPGPPRGA